MAMAQNVQLRVEVRDNQTEGFLVNVRVPINMLEAFRPAVEDAIAEMSIFQLSDFSLFDMDDEDDTDEDLPYMA